MSAPDPDANVEFGEHTEAAQRARAQQEEAVAAAVQRRRMHSMVVPTDDGEVRVWLRKLHEPMTLFGERQMERRERLRALMTRLSDAQRDVLVERLMQLEVENKQAPAEKFYTEGPAGLAVLRRSIAVFAAKRAQERLEGQRLEYEDAAAGLDERRLVLKDACSLANVSSQVAGKRPVQGAAVSPDNATLVTADWSGIVAFWALDDSITQIKTMQAHEERCTSVCWHPQALVPDASGETRGPHQVSFATASADSTAKLWNMSGECLHTCEGHTARLARLAFHPLGDTLATCSFDGTWRLWDTGTGACLQEQEGHSRAVYSIAFHGDGSLCASSGLDALTRLWDCRTGRNVLTFQGHAQPVLSTAFSPNGYHVATGSMDNTARLWDLRKKGALYCITAHTRLVSHVQFEPTAGHYLLTGSFDGTCKVWSAQTWQHAASLAGHAGVVMAADIAQDSGSVVTASYDKTIKLWRPQVDDEGEAVEAHAMEH